MKVLLVDDHALTRMFLREHLEEQGHEVVEAHSGQKALEILGAEAQTELPINAVITDCRMAGGSGVFLLQSMWRKGLRVPSLLHSSDATYREDGHEFKLPEIEKTFDFAKFHMKPLDGKTDYLGKFLETVQ